MSKKRYILNSAVITGPGNYNYEIIGADEAKRWVQSNEWESFVGYEETAEVLGLLLGAEIPVNRGLVIMGTGDEALVARLQTRILPSEKGSVVPHTAQPFELGLLKKT